MSDSGATRTNQSRNPAPTWAAAIAFGGVLTMDAMPPKAVLYVTARSVKRCSRGPIVSSCVSIKPNAIGTISIAAAVLLIHMATSAVTAASSTMLAPRWPRAARSTEKASAFPSPCLCKAAARANPPRNKKMMGCAKAAGRLAVAARRLTRRGEGPATQSPRVRSPASSTTRRRAQQCNAGTQRTWPGREQPNGAAQEDA